jgi:hypothetical protein
MNSISLAKSNQALTAAVRIVEILASLTGRVLSLVLLTTVALGQDAAREGGGVDAASHIEGRTVTGQSRSDLLRQIEIATEALLDRFNEINSDRDFDTECRERRVTGSKMSRDECQPRFVEEAEGEHARQRLRALQGPQSMDGSAGAGMGAESGLAMFEARVALEEMGDEMRRLIYEDEEFRAAAAHLGALQQALEADDERRANEGKTSAVIASAADTELPYDARLMAEVSVGRNAWEHVLINRTFAIAHLYGEIDSIALRCRNERARFEYELDAEWTVPEGWENCRLEIDAPRGTTFTLFEFE